MLADFDGRGIFDMFTLNFRYVYNIFLLRLSISIPEMYYIEAEYYKLQIMNQIDQLFHDNKIPYIILIKFYYDLRIKL